jgi:transposase
MKTEKSQRYTPEFRESSVKLAIESDQSIKQTAEGLGIKPSTLHTWIGKYTRPVEGNNKKQRTDEHLYDELKSLKKELAQVKQERDLLKKATAYFAREIK